jgi:hypothetical protein
MLEIPVFFVRGSFRSPDDGDYGALLAGPGIELQKF